MFGTTIFQDLKASIARAVLGEPLRAPERPSVAGTERTKGGAMVDVTRAAVAVFAYDATSWIHGVVDHTGRAIRKRSTGRIWLPSFVGLGATDIAFSSSRISRAAKGLAVVGAAGGAGLIASSTVDLWHAKTPEEFLDASGDLAWGAQGVSYLAAAPAAARFVTALGLIGAAAQMSAGVMRIARGVSLRDAQALKLGGLDLGGGILWAALDVAGWSNPIALGSYVVLMVGREAYANRDALRKSWPFKSKTARAPRQLPWRPVRALPMSAGCSDT
jgi:hypothetical protein